MVDTGLGQHRVVLDLRPGENVTVSKQISETFSQYGGGQDTPLQEKIAPLLPEGRSVVGDDDQLALSVPQGLEGLLVAQAVLGTVVLTYTSCTGYKNPSQKGIYSIYYTLSPYFPREMLPIKEK